MSLGVGSWKDTSGNVLFKSHVLDYAYVSACKNNSDRIPANLQHFEQRHEFNFSFLLHQIYKNYNIHYES
jgi:hypothetical protein